MHLTHQSVSQFVEAGMCPEFASALEDPKGLHPSYESILSPVDWDYTIPEGAADPLPLFSIGEDAFVRLTFDDGFQFGWLFHDQPGFSLVTRTEQGAKAVFWRLLFETPEEAEQSSLHNSIAFHHRDAAIERWKAGSWDKEWLLDL